MKLNDISILKNGKKCKYDEDGQIPIYGSNGVIGYTDKSNSRKNSIVIGRVGANAGSVFFSSQDHWVSDNAISVTPDTDKVNPHYLYYVLVKLNLNRLVEGSAQPLLNQSILNSFEIKIPDIQTQNKVVERINVFDKKIVLNKKINDNLLELANIIFTNRITKETVQLSNIATIQNGYAFKSKEYVLQKQLLILRTKNIGDNHLFNKSDVVFINQDSFNEYKKFAFKQFDTVLVMVGASIGKTGFITSNVLPSLQNQNMWRFRAKDSNIPGLLIYEYVNYINKRVKGSASGSARSFYRKKLFSDFEVPIIDNNVFTLFERIQLQINNIQVENNILSKLKQELLNKYF